MRLPSGESRIHEWAATKNRLFLYILTCMFSGVLVYGLYLLYGYSHQIVDAQYSELNNAHEQVAQLAQMQAKQKQSLEQKNSTQRALQKYDFASQQALLQDQLHSIINSARSHGLKITELQTTKPKHKKWYARHDVQLNVKGTLAQMSAMFADLSGEHKLIQCKSFICNSDKHGLYSASCRLGCLAVT